MATFMAWPEIESFHNIRKFVRVDPAEWFLGIEMLSGTSTVSYKAKVKLHGTNAAVQCHDSGEVLAQSRTNIISLQNDNAGFARWVNSIDNYWSMAHGHVVYGEWCGPAFKEA